MELPLAEKAGLGWRGKHTLLLSRTAGPMFFMGEFWSICRCGRCANRRPLRQCSACHRRLHDAAILGPGRLDARRCVSYLTTN